MKPETSEMYFKEGSSDKVYTASLERLQGTWSVKFEYGRRGSSLTTGTKIANVGYDDAKKVYNKLVSEKRGKGYQFVNNVSTIPKIITVGSGADTGWKPQLLNPIEENEVDAYIKNPEFCAQEKYDGRNRLLIRDDLNGEVLGTNRKGLEVAIPEGVKEEVDEMGGHFVMAGEAIDEHVMCFDIISMKNKSFKERDAVLKDALSLSKYKHLRPVFTAWTEKEKRDLYKKLRKDNAEGIVFKHVDAHYTPGRPASGGAQVKFKFVATCSVIAGATNRGKRSVEMWIHDGGPGINVGNVTVYPNQEIPKRGQILEVKYLYAYKGGSLFQPVLLGVRDDLAEHDCTIDQLKFKKED